VTWPDLATCGCLFISVYSYCDHSLQLAFWSALDPGGAGGIRREKRKTNRYQQIYVASVLPSPIPSYCTTTASFTNNDNSELNLISEVCF